MFYVGQKVVCVDASGQDREWAALREGPVYTIAKVTTNFSGKKTMVDIVELPPSRNSFGAYYARRFRPIQERKTDIAVFTEILRKATKRKPATV